MADLGTPELSGANLDPFRPWHNVVYQGYTLLFTRPDGSLRDGRDGLYDFDTRILSRYRLSLDGREPECFASGAPESDRWWTHLRVPLEGGSPAGPRLPQDALELTLERRVGRGMEEQLAVGNYSMAEAETALALVLAADFADVQEAGGERRQEGKLNVVWERSSSTLLFDYQVEHDGKRLHRAMRLQVTRADSEPEWDGEALRFRLWLTAGGRWGATLRYGSLVDGEWRGPIAEDRPSALSHRSTRDAIRDRWRGERTHLQSSNPVAQLAFERAADDLFALRNWELDRAVDAWVPSAGVPTFTGFFGRDSLTASLQAALLTPEMMRGTLRVVAETQAKGDSPWRDEEPGKMVHEIRRGPLSELDIIPQRAYYGTQTTSALFPLVLSEFWHWTGNTAALHYYRNALLSALDWAERYGDRDSDGFLEYVKRSPAGLKNQGWKDSDEAIRYPDGRVVENPIATVEEQAFHCIGLERGAEILTALGEDDEARRLLDRARELRRRWHEAYWMEDERFYAMALDAEKNQVRSIGSNPGHALGVGLVPPRYARAVADRLMAADLFSGWGIRTLSSHHPSYNPLAYHLGTVWPVENATIALGFKRYGLDDHVERLVTSLFAAAGHFQDTRLPEALGGHSRAELPTPTIYPNSNSPQAWSASAIIQLVQVALGIYPFAPARTLALVRPQLPAWLRVVIVRNLRIGDARVSIRFERHDDGVTEHKVVEQSGRLFVVSVPPPQDVNEQQASLIDRGKVWALDHAPGRLSSALRIALGHVDE